MMIYELCRAVELRDFSALFLRFDFVLWACCEYNVARAMGMYGIASDS